MPVSRVQAAAVGCPADGRIYVTGGLKQERHHKEATADVYAYHIKAEIWIARPPMITARYRHFMEVAGEKLYVMGGKNEDNSAMRIIEEYNTVQEQWSTVNIPWPQLSISSTRMGYVKDKHLYILNDAEKHRPLAKSSYSYSVRVVSKTQQSFNILKIDTSTINSLHQAKKKDEETRLKLAKRSSEPNSLQSKHKHSLYADMSDDEDTYDDDDDDDDCVDSADYVSD